MADALLSPAVGGGMWAATGATLAWSARKVATGLDDRKVPLMGVLGAFTFASQMVNFAIPGTGSSGHLGGGTILTALLGPSAAFLTMASVLTVQALFFADGGLLALGCNIFNLGFVPAFLAYPLVFRPLAGERPTAGRLAAASLASAVAGLQLGAFGVVLETVASDISVIPLTTFALLMQPVHLVIGVVEGLVTAAVVSFVRKARPEVLETAAGNRPFGPIPMKEVLVALAAAALVAGGLLSRIASTRPDGLEWSMLTLERMEGAGRGAETAAGGEARPALDVGTSSTGLLGGIITLLVAGGVGLVLRFARRGGDGGPPRTTPTLGEGGGTTPAGEERRA